MSIKYTNKHDGRAVLFAIAELLVFEGRKVGLVRTDIEDNYSCTPRLTS